MKDLPKGLQIMFLIMLMLCILFRLMLNMFTLIIVIRLLYLFRDEIENLKQEVLTFGTQNYYCLNYFILIAMYNTDLHIIQDIFQ